ncbi:hypothetical protein K2173_019592 [Erythroxylum novogranatense]|uniref:DUF4378 domain-containing protein n=1 Tax=Erythroxylum novogranatense TaxID=1862640 RepID=A0AAV8UCY7_9ROSI|nr:hypothetical protein K2173_019592 [Erythroxylum novogranatense]
MSKEAESKRRSPNVIARMMGLDGLPPQEPSVKHQKGYSGNLRKVASTKKHEKDGISHNLRLLRKNLKDEQEFKDVFEVLDARKMQCCSRYTPQAHANSMMDEAEMAVIRQKFKNGKQLSTDEKLHDSKQFHDAIDDLDSNKDLLLKFLDQPDSLFTKHVHDLQSSAPNCHCGQISSGRSLYSMACPMSGRKCKIEKEKTRTNLKDSHYFFRQFHGKRGSQDLQRSSKVQLEDKDEPGGSVTRIVVLKPNIGKVQNTTRTVSSSFSSHEFLPYGRNHTGVSGIGNWEPESFRKKKCSQGVPKSKCKSREPREIAKEITRQIRATLSSSSTNFSTSAFRGYSGDESSSDRSENDSGNELEVMSLTYRNSNDLSSRYRPSSSHTKESSLSREAKRRLSERWKLTHKSVDLGMVSRGGTLGEMLAIPDGAMRLAKTEVMSERGQGGEQVGGECAEPFGISSRDGWKGGCIQNLSRSKSLPASSTAASSPRSGTGQETLSRGKYMVSKEIMQSSRRVVNESSCLRESSSTRNSRSHNYSKKSHHSGCTSSDDVDTPTKMDFSQNQMLSNFAEGNQFKQNYVVSETSPATVVDNKFVLEDVLDEFTKDMTMSLQHTDPELSTSTMVERGSLTSKSDVLSLQEPPNDLPENGLVPTQHAVVELESAASSKEDDQPTPVSVLETPFADDLSSGSECFESLNADLHGLRMQLQLLKLESEAYAGGILVSSDEDVEDSSVPFSQENGLCEDSRDSSYVMHVLHESGIDDTDADTFIASWHSPDWPVNPLVFEELEKIYINRTSWTCSARRLLFDRVNLALLVIYQQVANPYPWVRQPNRISSRWIKNGLQDKLFEVLASQQSTGTDDVSDEVLTGELQWLDLENDIDTIGREIERQLTEELVEEIVAM